jgi:hypothetical protein
MHFLNVEAGYAPPQPVDPEDERAKLQREAIEAIASSAIAERLERSAFQSRSAASLSRLAE